MSPVKKAEALASRFRGATVTAERVVEDTSIPGIIGVVRDLTESMAALDAPSVCRRLDECRRVSLSGIKGWSEPGLLDATFEGPFVVLSRGAGDRVRERCAIERRDRGKSLEARLRLSPAVADRLGVVPKGLVLVYADTATDRLWVSTPGLLAAAALNRTGSTT